METFTKFLVTSVLCSMLLLQTTNALYGLCSTDWFTEGCFDNGDECATMGGKCRHDGYGDHGEGCACIKEVYRADRREFETLTKDHFKNKGNMFLSDLQKAKLRKARAERKNSVNNPL